MILTNNFFDFLQDLSLNNNKPWFDANRHRYEKDVKIPFEEFAIELGRLISDFDPEINKDYKKCIFRINKDIRFSKEKIPYKTNRSVAYSKLGKKDTEDPGYYIELGAHKGYIAGGAWNPSLTHLKKIRKEIYYCTEEFVNIIENPAFKQNFGELKGDKSKRLEKEAMEWAQDSDYIYFKQFYFYQEFEIKDALHPNFVNDLGHKMAQAYNFNQFLRRAMRDGE